MEKVLLFLWLCWWIVGQCLCQEPVTHPLGFKMSPTVSPTGHNVSRQWVPSNNYSPSRNISQPTPGITENTHYDKENTLPSILPVTENEKVHNGVTEKNSSEQATPSTRPAINANNDHENVIKNISSSNDVTTDNPNHLSDNPHSKHEMHTHRHDHNPVYEVGSFTVPESPTNGEKIESVLNIHMNKKAVYSQDSKWFFLFGKSSCAFITSLQVFFHHPSSRQTECKVDR